MTALLVSVKNVEEALLALEAGADIIDLKDPSIGALGALDLIETKEIVRAIDARAQLSATVGENHTSVSALAVDIDAYAKLGVDIIKIAVSSLFYEANFLSEMTQLTNAGVKIVAVFFADEKVDLKLLEPLQNAGFYGAMLDTQAKRQNLLQVQAKDNLQSFTQACKQHHLKSGLAGSLRLQHLGELLNCNATYIGFRGGVCDDFERKSSLSCHKVVEIKNMLRQHNKIHAKAQKITCLALHS
jgi:(5-formylfuran-3-yl)methyl phosphate synthase